KRSSTPKTGVDREPGPAQGGGRPTLATAAGARQVAGLWTAGDIMQRVIEYYYTHVSPWAYLGHRAFLDLADRHGYAIRFKPVLLGPVFAESGGLPLSKRHPLRQAYRLVELQRWREKRGLPLNLRPRHFPADPSLADRIALALALEGGPAGAFTEAAFRLTWVDDRDISDRPVL